MKSCFAPLRITRCLLMLNLIVTASAHAELWGISTDDQYSRVIKFDHVTGDELAGGILSMSAGLLEPSGIAISDDGTIYVSSRSTGKIHFYDSATASPLTLPGGDLGVFADFNMPLDPEGPAAPAQLKFGPDGSLYASEFFGQKVRVFDPDDGDRLNDAATMLPGAGGMAFESNGNLLVGTSALPEPPTPATISRFQNGDPVAPFFLALGGELAFPASLLFLPSGDLLAVDLFTDQIVRFSETGDNLGVFATIPTIITGKPSFPSDIVFDPDGNLIVSVLGPNNPEDPEGNQGQLLRYDLEGNLIEVIADELEQIGGLAWTTSPLTLAGNFDGVGGVDAGDFAKWRSDFGKFVAPGNGADGNGDGVVDAADYVVWRRAAAGGGGGSEPVPEPASALMVACGAMLYLAARVRKSPIRVETH